MCGGSGGTSGIGDRLEHDRPVGGERLVPGRPDLVGVVDADALQPDQLGVARVGEVGDVLRGVVARVALHRPLLPGHLVQVVVVQHEHDRAADPSSASSTCAIVISSAMPFICIAPSPTSAIAGRSG